LPTKLDDAGHVDKNASWPWIGNGDRTPTFFINEIAFELKRRTMNPALQAS
jgi:hypothetical protein